MTKRYKAGSEEMVEDFRVDTFLEAIVEVYKTYGLSLEHGFGRGVFIVGQLSDVNVRWLQRASIGADVELSAIDVVPPAMDGFDSQDVREILGEGA